MVTYGELFQFCLLIIGIVQLVVILINLILKLRK